MSNSMKSGAIGVLVGIVIALVAVFIYSSICSKPSVPDEQNTGERVGITGTNPDTGLVTKDKEKEAIDSPTNTAINEKTPPVVEKDNPVPPMKPVEKKPVPVSAIERVVPRILKAEFAMTGRGRDAKWGIGKQANFQYTACIEAKSEILSKETLPTGKIEVHEKRTFLKVYDSIVVSDVDFVLALNTLPMAEFSEMMDAAGILISSYSGNPEAEILITEAKNIAMQNLKKADGKGLRALLGWFGVQPNADIESKLNELAGNQLTRAIGTLRKISGKCFIINYLQEESGRPMMVDFKNEDGSEITDEEMQMVLKRVNAFIDYHLVPDKQCSPGDNWTVYAEDMQELFDPFINGTYTGKISVVRKSNDENGDWVIAMRPGTINVIGEGGTTTGSLRLDKGTAKMDPQNVSLNDIFVEGTARMEKLTKHHLLFTATIDGWCNYQGRAVTVPLKK